MAWQPHGNSYSFTKAGILIHAPETSGVFGLHNAEHQLYIGESIDIRATLLLHLSEAERQPSRFRPTAFAFEACAPERRAEKARRLVEQYRPVGQAEWPPADSWEFDLKDDEPLDDEFTSTAGEQDHVAGPAMAPSSSLAAGDRRFYFGKGQFAVLATVFALSLAVIFFLGILTGESLHQKATAGYKSPLVAFTEGLGLQGTAAERLTAAEEGTSDQVTQPVETVKTPVAGAGSPVTTSGESAAARPYAVAAALARAPAANGDPMPPADPASTAPTRAPRSQDEEGSWTVQLAAGREKAQTEKQIAELKARGYDGYVVDTERDGQTWYRIRVGRFVTRAEADALREVLEAREGYRTPFVTRE